MTQGKIERWRQTLKNHILLENSYLSGDVEAQIEAFVEYYNHQRCHENLGHLTLAAVYTGRGQIICWKGRRSNARPSSRGACSTGKLPPKLNNQICQSLS